MNNREGNLSLDFERMVKLERFKLDRFYWIGLLF